MLHLRLLCGHRIDGVRIVTGYHCVQELIHALSTVLPVQKPELKLMEGWEAMGIKAHSLGLTLAT